MVLLGQQTALVRHRGPRRRVFWSTVAAAVTLALAVGGHAIRTYDERPPWGSDIAYEAGYLQGNRVRHHDRTGDRVRDLLAGGCARMEAEGLGGRKATHNPALWVAGCLDGVAGRPSRHQGLAY
ncbi:hypothetical protein E2C00_12995 [Streptomyces sp. WAC05374]|uniref:hypothetical protein n=1 Tax=Streptomyces sp. WAC05374 TaxID=2487420 RepID=UPI000F871EDF|nr:hypothetical protein [Streptomyces sp. WAC05374]RST18004.1 hypothetical protein EF905_07105 [Streptomyces sp. WAC05374]TDF44663.1 hypothetical protein E2B92_14700 [Streptomyces sp. WAC05374]TDF56702.1 hypothetical protein E2C00_12995 [Streptomyces sp. WAC05374]TDF59922.1 hypothetical protein E2C02_04475 [Streptomyces sp. WAC05374]